jgi:hypothetical protein
VSDLKPTSRDHTERIRKLRRQRRREQSEEIYGTSIAKPFAVPLKPGEYVSDAHARRAERSGDT